MIDFALALMALRYFPSLIAFAPIMTKTYFSKGLQSSLYMALLCGILVDLFSTQTHFGISALNYTLTTLLIYRLKWRLSPHKLYSIAIYTFLFSLTSTTLSLLMSGLPFTIQRDFLIFPFIDGIYAFIWFSCPLLVYDHLKNRWIQYRHG